MSIDQIKAEARRAAFAARKAVFGSGRDAAAQAHLTAALAPFGAAPLSGYLPIRTEIDPVPVMASHPGPVGVPVILGAGQPLDFHLWTPEAALVEGPFGAKVPAEGVTMAPRVVIVPMLAFDARGYRLGYGGGFYDRTLARLRAAGPVTALGFAFDAQEQAEVPTDQFDQPLDGIVTESGLRLYC
ncbi:5-formyltetrahydrofolate cyclo-ligase [Pararhodobacter aggregans]|uniref:5-formyltetrahydrofolate cyclo-ligase n=1 Tax=Pararhodobacter aggregans TaxID=404875 RepID=A0A2T7ULZ3_9RHOB|nr:5-formyltetrahydrofolate cyclo-ligase [Pararhodobacter aggregans]PTX02182.1 5-formyltetrahydrofolate cyclo-ligase [Pararhodobacter aggregans]PVE45641.1 5-formyltetrahydrofolate cyclo-ligase [Pararhodobacter aggregans]